MSCYRISAPVSCAGSLRLAGLSMLLVLATSAAQAQNLLVNGDFEDPVIAPGGYALYFGGQTVGSGGWRAVGANVAILQTAYAESFNGINAFEAQHGLNSLDLTGINNSGPTSGVTQTVATTIGQTYNLSFYVGTADGNAPDYVGPVTANLSIDGGPSIAYTNNHLNTVPGGVDWEQFSTSFVATQANTTITFLNGTPIQTDEGGLDNVVLTKAGPLSVPEPGSLALLVGLTTSGAGWLIRRKRTR